MLTPSSAPSAATLLLHKGPFCFSFSTDGAGHTTCPTSQAHVLEDLRLSESESSSNWEDKLDDLLRFSKEAEAEVDSSKYIKVDQDSSPNLVIYSTPEGRTDR